MGITIAETLRELNSRLGPTSETAGLDAQVLLEHVVRKPRAWLLAHDDVTLTTSQSRKLEILTRQLEQGEPLPYVLGSWEFFGLKFEVNCSVLIPRPETEFLVEKALAWLGHHPELRQAADIGTGCGCIAITLAANIPDLHVSATDISGDAIAIASRNASKNQVENRVDFIKCDLLPPQGRYGLIAANLPYIPTEILHQLPIYGKEPTLALDGGEDGLKIIRELLIRVPERLLPGGLLLMEVEASIGQAALALAFDEFSDARIHMHKDLAGHDRLLEIQI